MPEYRIVVDDDDRDQCPHKPWTATVQNAAGELIGAGVAGLGATISDAIVDALARNYLAGTDEENAP
jgi:hypothetical protein